MREIFQLYYQSIKYWWPRVKGKCSRLKFTATKMVEVTSYLVNRGKLIVPKSPPLEVPPSSDGSNNINDNAKLAIVVPVFVRDNIGVNKLNNLIESILKQSYNHLEVIMIDDCSPISYSVPDKIRFVKQTTNQGPAAARNRGIEEALAYDADIVAFTDSDCFLHPEWASCIVRNFVQDHKTHVISGNTLSKNDFWLGHYQDINGTLNGRRFKEIEGLFYGATCNLAVIKKIVEHIRFDQVFPTAAGEDVEFCARILNGGFRIAYKPDVIVYHDYGYTGQLRKDLKIFWKQFARHAKAESRVLQLIPGFYALLDSSEEIPGV